MKCKINTSTDLPISIESYRSSEYTPPSASVILFDYEDYSKIIVKIRVNEELDIYMYTNDYQFGLNDITIQYIEDTRKLLVAGKRKSFVIDLIQHSVSDDFTHDLFWDITQLNNGYILETGELDCLLRDESGAILDRVPVDPPYETFFEDDGIRFESIVYGTTKLKYP
ncbi:hypothetical protein [Fontibacillus sp. BL9]|uniref:hypothetical protein n=1 Tax=Fontibacillus sp. BL9 TaxID=3389971 RepID=UPI00397E85AB